MVTEKNFTAILEMAKPVLHKPNLIGSELGVIRSSSCGFFPNSETYELFCKEEVCYLEKRVVRTQQPTQKQHWVIPIENIFGIQEVIDFAIDKIKNEIWYYNSCKALGYEWAQVERTISPLEKALVKRGVL